MKLKTLPENRTKTIDEKQKMKVEELKGNFRSLVNNRISRKRTMKLWGGNQRNKKKFQN